MKTSRARSGHASAGLSAETCWRAVLDRDALADGTFVFGVLTTGVYCRPSCPARRPLRRNVRFYETPGAAEREGLRACLRCKPLDRSAGKAKLAERLCRYMEANSGQKITLTTLSKVAGISRFYLQRLFTAEVGVSPAEYLQACRFAQFKQGLRGRSVTDAWAEAGYGSSSRVYETARSRLGMPPRSYRAGAPRQRLRFTTFDTALGKMMLAATAEGVCNVQFIGAREASVLLQSEYPNAELVQDDDGLAAWAARLREMVQGKSVSHGLPLDIQGTAFQQKVWRQLREIPMGQTRSYSEVAAQIGQGSAARAVARACATNRLAVVVPCHRVVHQNGGREGYRWGVDRKRKLLQAESLRQD